MMGCGRLMALLGLCVTVAIAWAQDEPPAWPERKLDFETVNEPAEAPRLMHLMQKSGDIKPKFVASLAVSTTAWERANPPFPAPCGGSKLLGTPSGQTMSERQRMLLASLDCEAIAYNSSSPGEWRDKPQFAYLSGMHTGTVYRLFAVTEDDARLMTRAMLEAVDQDRRQTFELTKARLGAARKSIQEAHNELPAVEAKAQEARAQLEKAKEAAAYDSKESAQADMRELERMLRTIDVEITGVRAKVEAIQRHKSRTDSKDAGTLLLLDRLLIEEDVNLAGALARRNAVDTHLKNAQGFCDALERERAAQHRAGSCRAKLTGWESTVAELEDKLRNPPVDMQPLEVFENKVIIQPLK